MTIPDWNQKDYGYGSGFDLRDVVRDDPHMHQYLLDHFSDYRTANYALSAIKEKWPQFNSRTKISLINSYQYNIVVSKPLNTQEYPPIRVIISGWNKLKYFLFSGPTLKDLDDPDKRVNYAHNLRSALLHAPVYWAWRMLGKLTKNKNWYNRGTRLEQDLTKVAMPIHDTVRLHLQRFYVTKGFQFKPEKESWPNSDVETIACAYYPPSDTLFVYKR